MSKSKFNLNRDFKSYEHTNLQDRDVFNTKSNNKRSNNRKRIKSEDMLRNESKWK